MRRETFLALQAHQAELAQVFREAAPEGTEDEDTIHLAEEIEARMSFPRGRIAVSIVSPVRGAPGATWRPYPYTGVTRFGHRGAIRPRVRKMLRWRRDGRTWFAHETAGHTPARDWVADAAPAAERVTNNVAERVGRMVYTRVLR